MGKGFRHDPLADINLLRQNLHDRYRGGFPIVKELIQNADDAGATRVEIGWTHGIPGDDHPLLVGPGLLVVNNGDFTEVDQNAICQISLSDKARQKSSIGKFGLGLKSIFHWCEAFFFLAQNEHFPNCVADILNPWSGESVSHYKEWDFLSSASLNNIRQRLAHVLPDERWFCLWVPLRRQAAGRSGLEPIQREYPGDNPALLGFMAETGFAPAVARLLPLLAGVSSVRTWHNSPGGRLEVAHEVQLAEGHERRHYRREGIQQARRWLLKGTVLSDNDNRHEFAGEEAVLEDASLASLQKSSLWPRETGIDPTTAGLIPIPEKADQHAAVVFMSHPAQGTGSLTISWGVFLPLAEPAEPPLVCQGSRNFFLLLHGDFFVDPGRNRPEVPAGNLSEIWDQVADESDLRGAWNRRLAEIGVLPLILPALDRFVSQTALDGADTYALTGALSISTLLTAWIDSVCRDHQWAYCIDPEGGRWTLLSAHDLVMELPPASSGAQDPFDILPGLRDACRHWHITFADWPRLTNSPQESRWPEELLLPVLDGGFPSACHNQESLDFLVQFLDQAGSSVRGAAAQNVLTRRIRSALAEADLLRLRANRLPAGSLLAFLNPSNLLLLPIPASDSGDAIWKQLLSLNLSVLPIPTYLAPSGPVEAERGYVRPEDALSLLQILADSSAEANTDETTELTSRIAVQVLEVLDQHSRHEVLEACAELPVFAGTDCSQNRSIALSWVDLQSLSRRYLLLRRTGDLRLAQALQQAIRQEVVVLIEPYLVFEPGAVPACNPASVGRSLLSIETLAEATDRHSLLSHLLQETEERPLLAIRYLLHASGEHRYSSAQLLAEGEQPAEEVWRMLASQALSLLDAEWRQVSGLLAGAVPTNLWSSLSMFPLGPDVTEALVAEAGAASIDCGGLTQSQREQVITTFDDHEVVKQLRIHPDLDGTLHSIGSNTFFHSPDFRVDSAFSHIATILRRSASEPVAYVQTHYLADAWSPRVAIDLALREPRPWEFAHPIIDAIRRLGGTQELSLDLRKRLKETAWLPARDGDQAHTPEVVLHIAGLEQEIARIAAASQGLATDLGSLEEGLATYNGFGLVQRELMPETTAVLSLLGEIISDCETLAALRIGIKLSGLDALTDFGQAFDSAPPDFMPAAGLVRRTREVAGEVACLEHLVPGLAAPIPVQRFVDILDYLSTQHERAPQARKSALRRVHDRYLAALVETREEQLLREVRLLNQRAQWRPLPELCWPEAAVDDSYLVNPDQCEILKSLLHVTGEQLTIADQGDPGQATENIARPDLDSSAHTLRRYFESWEDHCPRPLLAGFLSLLGDYPLVRELAETYFEHHGSVEATRSRLDWRPVPGSSRWVDQDIHTVMKQQRFTISVYDGRTEQGVPVRNLLGDWILVPPAENFEHLLVGDRLPHAPVSAPPDQLRTTFIILRSVDLTRFTDRELSGLLRETVRRILGQVYWHDVPNLDEVWEGLHEREQQDIRIAQSRIAETLFIHVRSLGLHNHPAIRELLSEWHQAHAERVDVEDLAGPDGERLRARAEQQARGARDRLRQLLESNDDIQDLFLTAVRRRLRDYRYTESSIPFELFQNADDAVSELQRMLDPGDIPAERRRFCIDYEDGELRIFHWGRPINAFRRGTFDGRSLGFDGDLEKMLLLAASDKGIDPEAPPVTGRFGLGFKSVMLLTRQPEVLSARLSFDVSGGLYPRRLVGEARERLEQAFSKLGLDRTDGTVFRLMTDEGRNAGVVMERFTRLVPVLLVFSRAIKECLLLDAETTIRKIEWNEVPVAGTRDVFAGTLELPEGGTSLGLVLRGTDGAILLCLGARAITPLPPTFPNVWVTAPTDHVEHLGFALNAPFEVDVGRSQLASASDHNRLLALTVGIQLAEPLRSVARQADRDWEGLRRQLALADDASPYEFWSSVWEIFAVSLAEKSDDRPGAAVARNVLWGSGGSGAMAALVTHHGVIPSHLPGDYRSLLRADAIRFRSHGALDSRDGPFGAVSTWDSFRGNFPPGQTASGKVGRLLLSMLPDSPAPKPVSLWDVLSAEFAGGWDVNPETAEKVGAVFTAALMTELQSGDRLALAEHEGVRSFLGQLTFLTRDGRYMEPKSLLTADSREVEERLRADFAPPGRVLSREYQEAAHDFFLVCRGTLEAPSELLAQWALDARELPARRAVLRYLAVGELQRHVAQRLQGRLHGTWMQTLQQSPLLDGLDLWQQRLVLTLLGQWPDEPPTPPPTPPPPLSPEQVLGNIAAWWRDESPERLGAYVRRVYPRGIAPDIRVNPISSAGVGQRLRGMLSSSRPQPDGVSLDDLKARKEWLKLFLLGATFTLGGVSAEQHRGFLEWSDSRGWLDKFAAPRFELGTFAGDILEYLEESADRQQFYYWMRLFVPLFQISNWLDSYVTVLIEVNKMDTVQPLNQLLSPARNPRLSGTGIHAPSLRRTLGIGACFVLRELVRIGVLSTPFVHCHCYVPSRPVRALMTRLGCEGLEGGRPQAEMSDVIYRFLQDHMGAGAATFDGTFDIPLLLVGQDPSLQLRLLHTTLPEEEGEDPDEAFGL